MTRPAIEVVHVGSACRDIAGGSRGWRIGGGVMYAALTTARLGLRTAAVVGVDDAASGASELDLLSDAGVDVLRVPLREGPIYHNVETPGGRVQTSVQPGVPLPIPVLPAAWTDAPGWSVVAVAGEVHDEWADVIPPDAHVAVAWQGFLRDLRAGERVRQLAPRPSPILVRADLVGVSRHDVAPEVPLRALWTLLRPGADLLITQGVDGGLLIRLGADGPASILRYRSRRATPKSIRPGPETRSWPRSTRPGCGRAAMTPRPRRRSRVLRCGTGWTCASRLRQAPWSSRTGVCTASRPCRSSRRGSAATTPQTPWDPSVRRRPPNSGRRPRTSTEGKTMRGARPAPARRARWSLGSRVAPAGRSQERRACRCIAATLPLSAIRSTSRSTAHRPRAPIDCAMVVSGNLRTRRWRCRRTRPR